MTNKQCLERKGADFLEDRASVNLRVGAGAQLQMCLSRFYRSGFKSEATNGKRSTKRREQMLGTVHFGEEGVQQDF